MYVYTYHFIFYSIFLGILDHALNFLVGVSPLVVYSDVLFIPRAFVSGCHLRNEKGKSEH